MIRAFGIISALPFLAVASSTTGCTEHCSIAGSSWPDHVGPFLPMPTGKPVHVELRITAAGSTEFSTDGIGIGGGWKPTTRSDLEQMLGIAETMTPQPYLVVDVAPEADCAAIRELAAELEHLPMCRKGKCLTRDAWNTYSGEPNPAT